METKVTVVKTRQVIFLSHQESGVNELSMAALGQGPWAGVICVRKDEMSRGQEVAIQGARGNWNLAWAPGLKLCQMWWRALFLTCPPKESIFLPACRTQGYGLALSFVLAFYFGFWKLSNINKSRKNDMMNFHVFIVQFSQLPITANLHGYSLTYTHPQLSLPLGTF